MENETEKKSAFAIARDEYRKEIYKTGKSLAATIRDNFKEIEEIIADGKSKKKNEVTKSAYTVIKEVLVSLGTIKSVDEISDNFLGSYISNVRKEMATLKSLNHGIAVQEGKVRAKAKSTHTSSDANTAINTVESAPAQTTTAEVSTTQRQPKQTITPNKVTNLTHEQLTSHEWDWNDTSWYHDINPQGFFSVRYNMFYNKNKGGYDIEPIKDEQGNYIWSDYWENMYRAIIRDAREKKLHDYQIQIPTGHHDSKVSYIWEKLTKVRKELGMNVDGKMYP